MSFISIYVELTKRSTKYSFGSVRNEQCTQVALFPENYLKNPWTPYQNSVKELSKFVDYHVELNNVSGAPDIELITSNETWETFTQQWIQ